MKNKEIAELFIRMGTLLQMQDENVFKVRSYFKASDNILNLSEDVETLKAQGRLSEIPGVGKALEEKIIEYLETGKVAAYDKLTSKIPETILDVINIPSVGPKKAKLFFDKLKVRDIDDLYEAALQNKLLSLPGIKDKTVENIIRGIKVVREGQERMNIAAASRVAGEVLDGLKGLKEVNDISPAGSLRRRCETVRDIDILVDSKNPEAVMDAFVRLPLVKSVAAHGETKSSILTKDNVQVDLRVVEPGQFGAALLYFTGSKSFNVKLRQIAKTNKMKVNEYGIFSVKSRQEKCIASKTEKDCLKALGLPFIPPELREEIGERDLFRIKNVPQLIEEKDIRGEFHVHSTWSDGRNSIAEMVETARKKGYEYIGISDHSPRLRVAGGVSAADLKKKRKEIDKLNKKCRGIRILFGTEVEIDTDGRLDYNDKILSEFDIVIAAIHSGFEQPDRKLTERVIRACENRHVHIIAHPTGVHIGKREPYDLDFKAVCRAAKETNTCLEINSFPIRLDLNSHNVYFARREGVRFAINTDAHACEHMSFMGYGVSIARRGWLSKKDVLNTKPLNELLKTIKK